ncbi:MAG TPA: Uma2 family endonuclease [Thermodesulfovibrionia bacterium]|nr:Uma2 family endonuclease [Thermodesulfovibrionia bacterium]
MAVTLKEKVWTDEELMSLPDDGNDYEFIEGELIMSPRASYKHGRIAAKISAALINFITPKKFGEIVDSSTGFRMKGGNLRSPDVSFISKERLIETGETPKGFFHGAPDLAVEILSSSDTMEKMHGKITEYFENGTKIVWLINPEEEFVLVYHSPRPDKFLNSNDYLDGEEVIPGFSFKVSELFQGVNFSENSAETRIL